MLTILKCLYWEENEASYCLLWLDILLLAEAALFNTVKALDARVRLGGNTLDQVFITRAHYVFQHHCKFTSVVQKQIQPEQQFVCLHSINRCDWWKSGLQLV